MTTTAELTTTDHCRPWCVDHDDGLDVCVSPQWRFGQFVVQLRHDNQAGTGVYVYDESTLPWDASVNVDLVPAAHCRTLIEALRGGGHPSGADLRASSPGSRRLGAHLESPLRWLADIKEADRP